MALIITISCGLVAEEMELSSTLKRAYASHEKTVAKANASLVKVLEKEKSKAFKNEDLELVQYLQGEIDKYQVVEEETADFASKEYITSKIWKYVNGNRIIDFSSNSGMDSWSFDSRKKILIIKIGKWTDTFDKFEEGKMIGKSSGGPTVILTVTN